MKINIFLLLTIISSVAFSQENTADEIIFGKWKTVSLKSKGKYYHNFDNDSLEIYSQTYFKGVNKDDSLYLIKKLKENSEESQMSYQFNTDSTCIITNFDKSEHKYRFSFDLSRKIITFSFINPKTQKLDSFRMKFGFINNQLITLSSVDSDQYIWKFKKIN